MKKILCMLSLAALCVAAASCEPEPEDMWKSSTYDYAGRYVYALCDETGENIYLSLEDIVGEGMDVRFYNTAANVANEVWMENYLGGVYDFSFKVKLSLSGTSESFSANAGANVESTLENFDEDSVPTAAGQTVSGAEWYARVKILEGKILPKAAKSVSGNVVDSLYLKITLESDEVTFVSVQTDPSTWATSGVPEYTWKHDPTQNVYDPTSDETYVLKGYRYTGFSEDVAF